MNREQLIREIQKQQINKRGIRRSERDIKSKEKLLQDQPVINRDGNFPENLKAVLPAGLMPSNVGSLETVSWPFWFNFEIDYSQGDNTYIPSLGTREVTKQISQEAVFIMYGAYRDYESIGLGGRGAPLQFNLRDRQSSRQLNDQPLQIQHIGEKGEPTLFPVPYVFMPNARLTLEFTSFLSSDLLIPNESGVQRIIIVGERIRTTDAEKIAEIMFY